MKGFKDRGEREAHAMSLGHYRLGRDTEELSFWSTIGGVEGYLFSHNRDGSILDPSCADEPRAFLVHAARCVCCATSERWQDQGRVLLITP